LITLLHLLSSTIVILSGYVKMVIMAPIITRWFWVEMLNGSILMLMRKLYLCQWSIHQQEQKRK